MSSTIKARPQFSNPFERQRSVEKVPTFSSTTPLQPLLTNESGSSESGTPENSGWRTRAASMFQSISSNSSNGSNTNSVQLKERVPSVAPRRPSYVPKYAARAHLSCMTGRMTSATDVEIDAQLRRESRMMSVISADTMSEASSSSSWKPS